MAKTLVVASRVKELSTHEGKQLNVSSDLVDVLTKKVEEIVAQACVRAVANGRTTVMSKDL